MSLIVIKIDSVDVSNYVVSCDNIPIYQRNRTGECVADSVNISVSYKYTTAIELNDVVEVTIDGAASFLGYVKSVNDNDSNKTYDLEVANYLLKLADFTTQSTSWLNKIYLVTDYSDKQDFLPAAVNTGTATITITSHGFADEAVVMLTSTGVLPDGINANQQYFVDRLGADDFQLTLDRLTPIAITTQGTGTHSITSDVDLNSYCRYDNEEFPNASISWILKKAFENAGMVLSTTSIDSDYVYTKVISLTTYNYTLGEVLLDTRMMRCINFPYASSTTSPEDAGNQFSAFELLKWICQIFRLSIRFTGTTASKQFSLFYNTATDYNVADNYVYSKSTEDLDNTLDSVFGTEYFADRQYYGGGSDTTLTAGESIECNNPSVEYSYPTNLKILLREKTGTPADGNIEVGEYMDIRDSASQFVDANEKDWTILTVETDIQSTLRAVKEVWLNVANKTFKIVEMDLL